MLTRCHVICFLNVSDWGETIQSPYEKWSQAQSRLKSQVRKWQEVMREQPKFHSFVHSWDSQVFKSVRQTQQYITYGQCSNNEEAHCNL